MQQQKVTAGRIVEFFPADKSTLPNRMESAPAIVTQVIGDFVNLCVFVADPGSFNQTHLKMNVPQAKSDSYLDGTPVDHWDWPARTEYQAKKEENSVPAGTGLLTAGQKAVGLTFNPSGDPTVNLVKQKYAEIIDILDGFIHGPAMLSADHAGLYKDAIKEAKGAQMWAVKAITWKD